MCRFHESQEQRVDIASVDMSPRSAKVTQQFHQKFRHTERTHCLEGGSQCRMKRARLHVGQSARFKFTGLNMAARNV
ncbi:hypothetical protein MRX96_004276 [Rhipicephalus microplus]